MTGDAETSRAYFQRHPELPGMEYAHHLTGRTGTVILPDMSRKASLVYLLAFSIHFPVEGFL
jgi:hypothetical protein